MLTPTRHSSSSDRTTSCPSRRTARCCPRASRRVPGASGCSGSATGPFGWARSRRPHRCAGTTDDVGEAVLRPPGWRTDVVLAERTDLTAEVILQGIGAVALVAEPTPTPDDDAIEAAVLAAAGRAGGGRRGRVDRGAGDRGHRQDDAGAPRPAGRPGLRGRRGRRADRGRAQRRHPRPDAVARRRGRRALGGDPRPGGRSRGRCRAAERDRARRAPGHVVPRRRRRPAPRGRSRPPTAR